MVKIAFAGGSGNVGSEIIDVLVATQKHEIVLLSRKEAPAATQGITWVQVDYQDQAQLTKALNGVHTVLSFISEQDDPSSPLQKNLINAAVQAGVKRFAPSEWASSGTDQMGWYAYKGEIRRYLQQLNDKEKVLEYTLFQPGLFLNYLTYPYKSTKHLQNTETPFDFEQCRHLVVDGSITFTTVEDLAQVVARAIDLESEWPVVGGISGNELSMEELVALSEKIRGKSAKVEKIPVEELKDGSWKSSWSPRIEHPSIPADQVDQLSKFMVGSILLGVTAGEFVCSDEWNQLLPDLEFTQAEGYLTKAWKDKP
ncbi:NAD(P)-binding protein [Aureobasidium pullulans]|nr:NAD(P)-binding protein [Aureobasidium pullulans]